MTRPNREQHERPSLLSTDAADDLLAAARSQDEEALTCLVREAMDYLHPVIVSMLHARRASGTYVSDTLQGTGPHTNDAIHEDAWDLTHSTCLAMLRNLGSFKGRTRLGRPVQFTTWLYAIAQNQVRDALRKRWREQKRRQVTSHKPDALGENATDQVPDPATPSPEERMIEQSERYLLEQGLQHAPLTAEQREALIMFYLLGYRQDRIAQLTGVQVGTVKKRIFDGLKKLRRYIAESDGSTTNAEGM